MLAPLRFLAHALIHSLRRQKMRLQVFRRFGFLLPQGAVILDANAITIGRHFGISDHCQLYCQDPANGSILRIGDSVKLNMGVVIVADCGGKIIIGNDVLIAPYVVIRAANHRFRERDRLIREQGHDADSVTIGDDVWLGASAVLLPGVTIGKGAVIGAGSVVSGDIPAYSIAVGAPARVIGQRGQQR